MGYVYTDGTIEGSYPTEFTRGQGLKGTPKGSTLEAGRPRKKTKKDMFEKEGRTSGKKKGNGSHDSRYKKCERFTVRTVCCD
jgi:hypothetical protein